MGYGLTTSLHYFHYDLCVSLVNQVYRVDTRAYHTPKLGSFLLHSVNLIVFTFLLVHLILRMSPHHSHHLHSHHLTLPQFFTPDLKLISFTNPFLNSHSYSFRTALTDLLNLYCIKRALAFVCFSFFFSFFCGPCGFYLGHVKKFLCNVM